MSTATKGGMRGVIASIAIIFSVMLPSPSYAQTSNSIWSFVAVPGQTESGLQYSLSHSIYYASSVSGIYSDSQGANSYSPATSNGQYWTRPVPPFECQASAVFINGINQAGGYFLTANDTNEGSFQYAGTNTPPVNAIVEVSPSVVLSTYLPNGFAGSSSVTDQFGDSWSVTGFINTTVGPYLISVPATTDAGVTTANVGITSNYTFTLNSASATPNAYGISTGAGIVRGPGIAYRDCFDGHDS